jgi:hypothetical protein
MQAYGDHAALQDVYTWRRMSAPAVSTYVQRDGAVMFARGCTLPTPQLQKDCGVPQLNHDARDLVTLYLQACGFFALLSASSPYSSLLSI